MMIITRIYLTSFPNYPFLTSSVLIIKSLPPYESLSSSYRRKRLLPPKPEGTPAYTLVLDLDETLVHCSMEKIGTPDLVFPVC